MKKILVALGLMLCTGSYINAKTVVNNNSQSPHAMLMGSLDALYNMAEADNDNDLLGSAGKLKLEMKCLLVRMKEMELSIPDDIVADTALSKQFESLIAHPTAQGIDSLKTAIFNRIPPVNMLDNEFNPKEKELLGKYLEALKKCNLVDPGVSHLNPTEL